MNIPRFWLFAAVALIVNRPVAAQGADPGPGPDILAPFKQELQQALRDGLARGPAEAVAACRVRAPEIAAALSRDGVRVGRASKRLRNHGNQGPDWVEAILDDYANNPMNLAPRTVSLPGNRSGYVEPIKIKPLCLTCHGANLAPELAARIKELYPADRATGYQAGDLRGVFWVEYPAPD